MEVENPFEKVVTEETKQVPYLTLDEVEALISGMVVRHLRPRLPETTSGMIVWRHWELPEDPVPTVSVAYRDEWGYEHPILATRMYCDRTAATDDAGDFARPGAMWLRLRWFFDYSDFVTDVFYTILDELDGLFQEWWFRNGDEDETEGEGSR